MYRSHVPGHLSVPGHNAHHPFVANAPHEEDPENLHAGGYFPQVEDIFATINVHVKTFDNVLCSTCSVYSLSL
jgi:hypothetical protein